MQVTAHMGASGRDPVDLTFLIPESRNLAQSLADDGALSRFQFVDGFQFAGCNIFVGFALGHGVREWAFRRDHSHQRRRGATSEVRRGSRGRLGGNVMSHRLPSDLPMARRVICSWNGSNGQVNVRGREAVLFRWLALLGREDVPGHIEELRPLTTHHSGARSSHARPWVDP
jgi:hypothetical protein